MRGVELMNKIRDKMIKDFHVKLDNALMNAIEALGEDPSLENLKRLGDSGRVKIVIDPEGNMTYYLDNTPLAYVDKNPVEFDGTNIKMSFRTMSSKTLKEIREIRSD